MILPFAAVALYLMAGAFFAGAETGFYSVNTLRLRLRVRSNRRDAATLHALLGRLDETIMTALVGTNVMLYAATAVATELWSASEHAEFWVTLSMTPIIFIFSEMAPKDLFRRKADSVMYPLAGLFDGFRCACWPFTAILRKLVAVFTKGLPREERHVAFSHAFPDSLIAEAQRDRSRTDYEAVLPVHAIRLLAKKAVSVVIPLSKVIMLDAGVRGQELHAALTDAPFPSFPVFRRTRTNIVGILHALDYACLSHENLSAGDLAEPAPTVNENDTTTAVLVVLQSERRHMAIVVDAEGTPTGIVTLTDLVDDMAAELHDLEAA